MLRAVYRAIGLPAARAALDRFYRWSDGVQGPRAVPPGSHRTGLGGRLRLVIRARLRRIVCPTHGVRTGQVPFARVGPGCTRDVEDLVAWLATRMDRSAVRRLVRVAWQTVGAVCARVVADEPGPGRLDGLSEAGTDEVSWRYVGDPVKGFFLRVSLMKAGVSRC